MTVKEIKNHWHLLTFSLGWLLTEGLNVSVLQVDRKEIAYVQTPIEAVGWEAMDSVTFHVTSPPSSLESQTFKIDISYENTGPEHNTVLLANTGMSEGVHR